MGLKLNLGGGKVNYNGFANVDIIELPNVDIVHDLNKYPYPFKDNSVDEIICNNILEHLDDIIKPIEEIWRISKNGALVIVRVPIFPSVTAFADPTHKSCYTYTTFDYFRPFDNLNYYSKARFKILRKKIVFHRYLPFITWFFNISLFTQKLWAIFLYFLIPAESLYFELEVLK